MTDKTNKNPITTHVLDVSRGRPAGGIAVQLDRRAADGVWQMIGSGATHKDGRLHDLTDEPLQATAYRLRFDTEDYFASQGTDGFYPAVTIEFQVAATDEHYHVPLLISPFGYSTYRGS